nr:hypothetical protein Iba_chr13dCG5500 [Ipomoea batatas]
MILEGGDSNEPASNPMWLGAIVYSAKVQAKLSSSRDKLPTMEDNFQALSIEELKGIDQASLQEGIQRSLVEFQCYLGVTSRNSSIQTGKPVASHVGEIAQDEILEEPVMIPGHSHAMVQIVESIEGLGRIPVKVCEVQIEKLATDLAIVPIEIQEQTEATVLTTVPTKGTVQVEKQATVLATVDTLVEVNVEYTATVSHEQVTVEITIIATVHSHENQADNKANESEEVTVNDQQIISFNATVSHSQVELPKEIQDSVEEEEQAPSTKRKKVVIPKTSETSEPNNDNDLDMEKQPKKDQVAWVVNQNRRLEDELKKGPEVTRRKMFYVTDEDYMMHELMDYTGHEDKYLDARRSFAKCIKWFREGVLPGGSIEEAYEYYITGDIHDKYKNANMNEIPKA